MRKVCIIGAGASGITAAKTLKDHCIAFDCYELGSDIGGNWRYDNDNGRAAAYASLRMDTSKERVAFSDFPMPDDYPNYPSHEQVLEYFEHYVDHFGIRPLITFRTRVESVVPTSEGNYAVTFTDLDSGSTRTYRYSAVLACTGHHWDPNVPELPGTFTGRTFHSRDYRTPAGLEGTTVLVVGIGNSGVDIACEASSVSERTFLSTRRSNYVVPRYVLGRPTDKWVTPLSSHLPLWLQRTLYRLLLRLEIGSQEQYGVPEPDHPLLSSHPTVSQDFLQTVAAGAITMKPDVGELAGETVRFVDGSEEAVDVIVFATGYRISFPFLDADFLSVEDNEVGLYRNVVHPEYPRLFFIGLIQPIGALMPLAELQAKWVAGLLAGKGTLPDRRTMEREIAAERSARKKRYVESPRHTIEVEYYPYMRCIRREIRRGFQRARRQQGTDVSIADDSRPVEA